MKYCSNCGKELKDDAKFCEYCGTKQDDGFNFGNKDESEIKVETVVEESNESFEEKTFDEIVNAEPISRECPVCGAIVSGSLSNCPICGARLETKTVKIIHDQKVIVTNNSNKMNVFGLISFILGLVSVTFLSGKLAIIAGLIALGLGITGVCVSSKYSKKGKVFSIIGIVTGAIAFIYGILWVAFLKDFINEFLEEYLKELKDLLNEYEDESFKTIISMLIRK